MNSRRVFRVDGKTVVLKLPTVDRATWRWRNYKAKLSKKGN